MKTKLGVVCAFIEEQPSHSKYNIRTLVESLKNIPDLQILVISNGCKLSEGLIHYLDNQPKTIFLELSQNIGLPAAWNLGIDLIESDYIFFLNDDIWLDQDCLNEIINVFETKPDSAAVGVEGVLCSELGENGFPVTNVKYKKKKRLFAKQRKEIVDVTNVSGFLFAISKEFLVKTGFRFDSRFTPAFCEEFDLAYFARKNGYKTRIVTGLDGHYEHSFGVSEGSKEIYYLDKTIWSDELSERNVKLFCQKWGEDMSKLLKP